MNEIGNAMSEQLIAVFQRPEFTEVVERAMQIRDKKTESDPEIRLHAVLGLLKEYTQKLEALNFPVNPADELYLKKLRPPAKQLAQFVSQRLNSTKDEVFRPELQLRLAEFECALEQGNSSLPRRTRQ
jgi:hypothetical protein